MSTMDASTTDELLPLTPAVFHILLVLAGGDAHGYGIMGEVDRLTDGKLRLGPGTLYRSVYKMMLDGFIEEVREEPRPADERRLTYRITRQGLRVARAEARRLESLVRVARRRGLIDDKRPAGPRRRVRL
jgi:DNA-binding PadR family transcriptional regulator